MKKVTRNVLIGAAGTLVAVGIAGAAAKGENGGTSSALFPSSYSQISSYEIFTEVSPVTSSSESSFAESSSKASSAVSLSKVSSVASSSKASSAVSSSKASSAVSSSKVSSVASSEEKSVAAANIVLISVTSPVGRNETATLTIKGEPNTTYFISVYYSTTASKAAGLEKKTSDSEGYVTWSWKVGGSTKGGTHGIVISGGDKKLETSFTTTE